MKLLAVADLHYSLKQFDWVSAVAGDFDLVVVAGDLLDQASAVDLDTQILVVLKYLRRWRSNASLVVASGNHDVNARNEFNECAALWLTKARKLGAIVDGDDHSTGDVLFSICPWWDGVESFKPIVAQLERDSFRERKKWCWIYHAPPNNTSLSWTGKTHFGDEELGGLIERFKPDVVFSGHVHQAPFRDGGSWVEQVGGTIVFNAGRQLGAPPAYLVFDSDANTVEWHSQMANELIHLERPDVKIDLED